MRTQKISRRRVAALSAIAVVTSACSSSTSDGQQATVDETSQTSSATSVADEENQTESNAGSEGKSTMVTFKPADSAVELSRVTTSAMGGASFSYNTEHFLFPSGDSIVVSIADPALEDGWETASVGLLTQSAAGSRIETVDDVLSSLSLPYSVEVTPTDTHLELFGFELAGYQVVSDDQEPYFFATERRGAAPSSLFSFVPNAEIFLAETPAGVLYAASAEADDPNNLDAIGTALGTMLDSVELHGPGFDAPLPEASIIESSTITDDEPRGELDPDGPEPLEAPFSDIAPGTYQIANFGRTFSVDIAEEMEVQPNFPGIVVLTGLGSGGPGDRDIVFFTGVTEVVRTAGPIPVGEPIAIESVDQIAELPGIEVSDAVQVLLGDVEATQMDISLPPDSTCALDNPCEYTFLTTTGFTKPLQGWAQHRIWWFEDEGFGPSMIVAMAAPGSDFIGTATTLVETMVFS